MEVIGEKLKTSREEKGLSLQEVSDDLKIDVKNLSSIESGNRSAFSDVFELKQSIYEYAKYLGLDCEKLVEEFNEFMYESTSKIPSEVIERISKQKEIEEMNKGAMSPYTNIPSRNNKQIITIALIVFLILISIFIYVYVSGQNDKTDFLSVYHIRRNYEFTNKINND